MCVFMCMYKKSKKGREREREEEREGGREREREETGEGEREETLQFPLIPAMLQPVPYLSFPRTGHVNPLMYLPFCFNQLQLG